MAAEAELRDALEEHRQAVCCGDRDRERIEAGLERLVAKQSGAEALRGVDGELLVGIGERLLDAPPQRVGGRGRVGKEEDPLGLEPLLHQPAEPAGERVRLARARPADEEERAAAMGDGRALLVGQSYHRL